MKRRSTRKISLIEWAVFIVAALFFAQLLLPANLQKTAGTDVPVTAADRSADILAGFAAEERDAIEETWTLIRSNGPFPYAKDGSEFQNREGRLPDKGARYYREFTVETPGSPDRGARRIVTGRSGEIYYTRDHYQSFIRLN